MHIWRKQHTHTHTLTHAHQKLARGQHALERQPPDTHTHTHTLKCILWTQYTNTEASRSAGNHRELKDWSTPPPPLPPSLTLSFSHTLSLSLWALQQGIAQDWTPLLHLPLLYFNRFCPSSNPSLLLWQPLLLAAEGYFHFHIGALRELLFAHFSHNSVCVRVCVWERECVCVCELGGGGRREGQHLKTVSETLLTYNTHTHAHITVCLDLWLPCLCIMFAEGWFYETHTPVVLGIEHAMSSFFI